MGDRTLKLAHADGVTVSEMEGDLFLVKPDSGEIYHLDAMAAAIWNATDAPVSREELRELFVEAFPDQDAGTIKADLEQALSPLLDSSLLVETGPD